MVNPITVKNCVALFNCWPAGRVSDLMKAPACKRSTKVVGTRCSVLGFNCWISVLQRFTKCLAIEYPSCFSPVLNPDLYVCCFDS